MRILTEFQKDTPDHDGAVAGPVWAKAPPLGFSAGASAEDALCAAIANGLDHLGANESCVLGRFHVEGVHQMRVAVRRLRSRVAIYSGVIPEDHHRHADRELKWLIRRLGPARDWDVFLDEVLGPVITGAGDVETFLTALHAAGVAKQERAYTRAGKAIRSTRYAALKRWLDDWSLNRRWRDGRYPDEAWAVLLSPAADLAHSVLQARHDEVVSRGERLSEMSAEERHALRIRIKALRYAAEFFEELYAADAVRPYLACLKALQDSLGQMNDLVVARGLMNNLVDSAAKPRRPDLALAAGVVLGWHERGLGSNAGVAEPWQRFLDCPPFWETGSPRFEGKTTSSEDK